MSAYTKKKYLGTVLVYELLYFILINEISYHLPTYKKTIYKIQISLESKIFWLVDLGFFESQIDLAAVVEPVYFSQVSYNYVQF